MWNETRAGNRAKLSTGREERTKRVMGTMKRLSYSGYDSATVVTDDETGTRDKGWQQQSKAAAYGQKLYKVLVFIYAVTVVSVVYDKGLFIDRWNGGRVKYKSKRQRNASNEDLPDNVFGNFNQK
ncbi:uncharacterized protein C8R40DRAFT_1268207 [Lentinula edodes]|uniref:uncharacterized protein n=1 Tax=Lentinula edodes TaxID=5353 RepID=UPI001E8EB8E4|nr:uncharacterized protein C8R40DRAFT_1268207 [Lentinula edodes]KAH7870203.1 hypothetical protein C8R40DRAFT_1268207 [Lentinula edodes]